MTATVVPINSHRRNREPACGCPRHLLEAVVERSLVELSGTEGELLIPRRVLVEVVDDLTTTVRAALAANQHERTTP